MFRRLALVGAAAMALAVALIAPPASAVVKGTTGTPDTGTEAVYPFVGTLVIWAGDPDESNPAAHYHYWCSGTMITPTVFLAAGHCFDTAYMASVFGAGTHIVGLTLNADVSGYAENTNVWAPIYQADQSDPLLRKGVQAPGWPGKNYKLDVGAYVLSSTNHPDLTQADLPDLPTLGQLDTMGLTGQQATIVGYGMTRDRTGGRNGFSDFTDGIRTYATERITGVNPTTLHLLGNIAAGGSGPCAGDSGAPRLVGEPGHQTIVAISYWAGPYCQAPEMALRLDTQAIQDFIHGLTG
jgi:hypothetical protein